MRITLASLADEMIHASELSPHTKRSYEGTLIPFVLILGSKTATEVTRDQIKSYLDSLTHLGWRTHNRHQTIVTRLFNFALEKGIVAANPALHLRSRKPDAGKAEHGSDEEVRYLSGPQVDLLMKAAERTSLRLYALVRFLYESGARISEVLALNLTDVDLEKRQFQVIGKGNKKRWCFFGVGAHEALSRYLSGGRHHPHHALFTKRGARLNDVRHLPYPDAHRDLQAAKEGYNSLEGVRFHDLRHTFATERARLVPLEVLRALLGHESIQTTLLYQKITSHVAREAALGALTMLSEK